MGRLVPAIAEHDKQLGTKIEIELPHFVDHFYANNFMDWLLNVEELFTLMKIPEQKYVPLVAFNLKGYASVWWEQLQNESNYLGKDSSDPGQE